MSKYFIVGFFFVSFYSKSQSSFELTTCDDEEPIPFAHIQNTTSGKSTISNQEGMFSMEVADEDLILITHISYQPLTVEGTQLSMACMVESAQLLEEVIVEANSNHTFLMDVLEKTQKKLMLPGKLKSYYKEFVKRDNEYTHFCDADVVYHIDRQRNDLKIKGSVPESRAYILPISESNDDYLDLDLISPVGYKKTMELYDPVNIKRFFKEDAFENYEYEIFKKGDYLLMRAKAVEDGEGVYEGEILINSKDSTISSIKFFVPDHRKEFTKEVNALVARLKLLQNEGYFIYSRTDEGEIYPSFLRMTYDLRIWNKKKINQVSSFITDINVYEIPENQSEIEKKDLFSKKSIYKQGTNFQSQYWSDKSLIGLTDKEKEIIQKALSWKPND